MTIKEAQAAWDAELRTLEAIAARMNGATGDERKKLDREFTAQELKVTAAQRDVERCVAIAKAYGTNGATARGSLKSESPYRPDGEGRSFFRDVVAAAQGDVLAGERLTAHQREAETFDPEQRAVTTADPGAGSFIPPIYMGSQWIDKERFRRPFADAVTSIPYSPVGKQMDFPRVATAPTTAVQVNQGDAPSATDFDGETYSVPKITIAGQNDWSIQAFDWSQPGADEVVMRELVKAYNANLDTQLLAGTGANGQHTGIRAVANINTQTFSSGNAAALLGKIYAGMSDVSTNAPGYYANAIVLHPRRAAWISSHRDTSTPLLQQGQLIMSSGTQDHGFAGTMAGVQAILDGNIGTAYGTSTNEDEAYLVDLTELMLAESPLRVRTLSEVLSGTLQVRLQVFAYSAFAGGRRPKVICKVSGSGLSTPVFPST